MLTSMDYCFLCTDLMEKEDKILDSAPDALGQAWAFLFPIMLFSITLLVCWLKAQSTPIIRFDF